jgi:hypothetical protein
VIRLRIVQHPPIADVDGIRLDYFEVGAEYHVGNTIAALLLAEGWAEPVPLDAPAAEPFASDERIDPARVLQRRPDLVRQLHRTLTDRATAADPSSRNRRR